MSIDNTLNGVQSITRTIQSGVNAVARAGADVGLGGVGQSGTYWKDRLQQASYRGVPFGVLSATIQFGRRNAVHQYPFRDTVWVEDLGKSARRITMTGFLVENPRYAKNSLVNGITSVIAQRDRMIAAVESAGDGELVHPTLGRMTVSNMNCTAEEHWDQGRVFALTLSFIEGGKRIFPSVQTSTGDAVETACKASDYAAQADFVSATTSAMKQGAAVVQEAVTKAAQWGRKAQNLVNDATNLYNMVGTLKGSYGRYFGGRTVGLGGATNSLASQANSVAGLISLGSAARGKVSSAISNLTSIASELES